MAVIVATWGRGNLLAVREDTGEVLQRAGPDVDEVVDSLRRGARRWLPGDAVRETSPGDPDHVRHVLSTIPGVTIVPS